MSKENKYILWAIGLPLIAMLAIGFDLFKPLGQAASFFLLLALLLPSPILVYLAKKEVFSPKQGRNSSHHAKRPLTENPANRQLRKLAIILQLIGAPLVITSWQIIRNTNRVVYYMLGGIMLVVGTVLVGVSVGIMKAANE